MRRLFALVLVSLAVAPAAVAAVRHGTAHPDRLIGTSRADVIEGLAATTR